MYTRIGTDPTGKDIAVDTSIEEGRIALLGEPGRGKTTTCRFLARGWAAQDAEHCVILTPRVHEYADLHRDNVHVLSNLDHDQDAWAAADLLIVDEAELIDRDMLDYVLQSMVNTAVVASYGPAVDRARDAFTDVFAVRWNSRQGEPVQGRLDWPGALDVFLDKRERCDYPQHRWAVGAR